MINLKPDKKEKVKISVAVKGTVDTVEARGCKKRGGEWSKCVSKTFILNEDSNEVEISQWRDMDFIPTPGGRTRTSNRQRPVQPRLVRLLPRVCC